MERHPGSFRTRSPLKSALLWGMVFILLCILFSQGVRASPVALAPQVSALNLNTVTLQVGASHDDAWDRGWIYDAYSDDSPAVYLGRTSLGVRTGGFRFSGVSIPQGAHILSATLSLRSYGEVGSPLTLAIAAHNADDSPPFSSESRPSQRDKTMAQVDWTIWAAWMADQWYDSPDLSAVIQEVVARGGWSSGNAFALLVSYAGGGTAATRQAWAYDGDPSSAARLTITYLLASPTPTVTETSVSSPTATDTPSPTLTATLTATNTSTATPTPTDTTLPAATETPTATATITEVSSPTATSGAQVSATPTPSPTATSTATSTPTETASPTGTPTPSSTPTRMTKRTVTATPSPTVTSGITLTATPTPTATSTPSPTPTATPKSDPDDPPVYLPAIDNMGDWETWVQVQNVGSTSTAAIAFLWADYSGVCLPQAPGPLWVLCSGTLWPGSAWTWKGGALPAEARSGIVYSVNLDIAFEACEEAFEAVGDHFEWLRWVRTYAGTGQPLAVSVNRQGPSQTVEFVRVEQSRGSQTRAEGLAEALGGYEPVLVASTYTGISEDMLGVYDPWFGGQMYYAPLNFNDYNDLTTTLIIQNAGDGCTSVEIWYKEQGDCLRARIDEVLALAPGEAVRLTPPNLPLGTKGSAWIRASQPLAIIVDESGRDLLLTYRGVPADSAGADFTAGSLVNYVPLLYREFNGWETGIQVQNLSSIYNAKVKVAFLDNGGGIITTLVDWICPRGSQNFYLPVINDLPGQYVGAAIVSSQGWLSPGDPAVDATRITSVVNLINYGTGQALAYNALTTQQAQGVGVVGLPLIVRENQGLTSEIAIQNLNPYPGYTTFMLNIFSSSGLVDSFCFSLGRQQVLYLPLDNIRVLNKGFRGSAVISVTSSDQSGGASLGAVMVERGDWTGDISKATEGFPIQEPFDPGTVVGCH